MFYCLSDWMLPSRYGLFSFFFFSSRRRHTRYIGDWSSDVCSSDLLPGISKAFASRPRLEGQGSQFGLSGGCSGVGSWQEDGILMSTAIEEPKQKTGTDRKSVV